MKHNRSSHRYGKHYPVVGVTLDNLAEYVERFPGPADLSAFGISAGAEPSTIIVGPVSEQVSLDADDDRWAPPEPNWPDSTSPGGSFGFRPRF